MPDLELYIGPDGYILIGGKEVRFPGQGRSPLGDVLHAFMLRPENLKDNKRLRQLMAPEWIRLAQLWDDVNTEVLGTVYNATATKTKGRKEGYVTINLFVDMEVKPKARLRWGPERPPTSRQVMNDLMALLDLVRYDLRLPAVFEEFEGHFALGVVVKNVEDAEKVVDYFERIPRRNFPHVFRSLIRIHDPIEREGG